MRFHTDDAKLAIQETCLGLPFEMLTTARKDCVQDVVGYKGYE